MANSAYLILLIDKNQPLDCGGRNGPYHRKLGAAIFSEACPTMSTNTACVQLHVVSSEDSYEKNVNLLMEEIEKNSYFQWVIPLMVKR